MDGIWAYPDSHLGWFDCELVGGIPKRESFESQMERDSPGFSWSQNNTLEAFQRADGLRSAGTLQTDIQLNQLFSRARAGVGDIGLDGQG